MTGFKFYEQNLKKKKSGWRFFYSFFFLNFLQAGNKE